MARPCAYCTNPIPAEHPAATYCRNACRQAAYKARQRGEVQPRGVVHLDDVLHLLRFGVRLDVAAGRLGVTVRQIATAVYGLTAPPDGMTALDVATLRRLVRADQQRATDDAMADHQNRQRAWRWAA